VARVLISEPHPDCRALLELVVERAGHEPLDQHELAGADDLALLILEPASSEGLAIAHRLRRRLENLPIICTSVCAPDAVTESLRPAAYLVKPFRLSELDEALANVLA
jgi:DNA-binding response OmpR family regulator